MKRDLEFGFPGYCSRCGAVPNERCDDYHTRKDGKQIEACRCIVEGFDSDCDVFHTDGFLWIFDGINWQKHQRPLQDALRIYQSLWELKGTKFYQWYRGRYLEHRFYSLSWWSVRCPEHIDLSRPVYWTEIESRQMIVDRTQWKPLQLSLFYEGTDV